MNEKYSDGRLFAYAILFGVLYSALMVLIPFLVNPFFDVLKAGGYKGVEISYLLLAGGISIYILLAVVFYLLFYYFSRLYVLHEKRRMERGLIGKIFGLNYSSKEAVIFFNRDITSICNMKYRRYFDVINSLCFILFGLLYACLINVYALIIVLFFLLAAFLVQAFASPRISRLYAKSRGGRMINLSHITSFLDAKSTIRNFGAYEYGTGKTGDFVRASADLEERSERFKGISNVLVEGAPTAATIFTSLIFMIMISRGYISQENVLPIVLVSGYIIWEGIKLFQAQHDIASVKFISERLESVVAADDPRPKARISFKNLSVKNISVGTILNKISFDIAPGEKILVIGHNGSGKTTLLRALLGEIEHSGKLYSGGKEVHDFSPFSGMLPHECELIAESVLLNITLDKGYDKERLKAALRSAGISENYLSRTVDLENSNFSSGERRRIAFARALYHRPPLLILDEFTDGLDIRAKKTIESAVLGYGGSVLAVSHNAGDDYAAKFDSVLVLRNGEIVYRGDYAGLPDEFNDLFRRGAGPEKI